MKRFFLLMMASLFTLTAVRAEKKPVLSSPDPAPKEEERIKWLSMDELQTKMKAKPKKVFMDVYTDWCGWCKKMEVTTFENPEVIRYMNGNFYCVRFNAERKDTFRFLGTYYFFDPEKKANTLVHNLMRGQMTYPTSIIMEELYQNPQPVPGYLDVKNMEMILTFFATNSNKKTPFPDYQKSFKPTWKEVPEPNGAPVVPGH